MELVSSAAEEYAARYCFEEDDILRAINLYTTHTHEHAHMLSGQVQGSFLTLLSSLLQPQRILEIGTFTGYSALCLAKGLQAGGKLHTIDVREEDANTARRYFDQSVHKENIELHVGNASEIIPTLDERWDLVFIDADKAGYIDYYELVLPSVRPNGIIIADNVLFHGQVLEENIKGKNAKAIYAFNEHVKNDNRVRQVLLTVRDGLMLVQKF